MKHAAINAPAMLTLALALMLAAGCNEEAKPKAEAAENAAWESEGSKDLCDGKEFDAETQFCHNDKLYDLCFTEFECDDDCPGIGSKYDPETEVCQEYEIRKRCNEETYDSPEQFCLEGVVYYKCNGKKLNASKQFCYNGEIYEKCDDLPLYPDVSASCSGGKIVYNYGEIQHNGKTYKTIKIGSQTWMAEDLGSYSWAEAMGIDAKFNNEEWKGSAEKHKGICPEDWHLPSKNEWETLFVYVNKEYDYFPYAGLAVYGFFYGAFHSFYWSSNANAMQIAHDIEGPMDSKNIPCSVRCVKN